MGYATVERSSIGVSDIICIIALRVICRVTGQLPHLPGYRKWRPPASTKAKVTHLIASYTVRPYTLTIYQIRPESTKDNHMEGAGQNMAVSHSPPQERANLSSISVLFPSTDSKDKGPVPMSFPSILRNSGLTSRYVHLQGVDPVQPKKFWRRNDNDGKRWVRRRENGASHLILCGIQL